MPDISSMKSSKYLKKEDVGRGKLMTISEVVQQNVALESQPAEMKWVCYFEGEEKGMVLNSTNAEAIADILKERNSDNWGGGVVVLYDDPNVSYAGKRTGGIRVRAPRQNAATASTAPARGTPAPQPQPGAEPDWGAEDP